MKREFLKGLGIEDENMISQINFVRNDVKLSKQVEATDVNKRSDKE